ncbi:hypothetical protein EDB81DRAFT_928607 [Dactylonectria macrodidyma]|uniref:Ubiquitin-like domain-containing protein n=1 Tax=Dactylonectria macrodidyma TaxID=307937 RepID=A0A9P9F9S2_9HYPO|nr:hypothetical protein EDB81DRAFT_928607 [Dactylonectria macrodidyma]
MALLNKLESDTLLLGDLDISFMRTVKVPVNQQLSELPPSIGKFLLFQLKDYAEKMPQEMVDKGGLFMPMYRRGSARGSRSRIMWLYMIKSCWMELPTTLDKSDNFVAVLMGSGHSVEDQRISQEVVGGIQFEITPEKKGTVTVNMPGKKSADLIDHFKSKIQDREGIPTDSHQLILHGNALEENRTLDEYDIKHEDYLHLVLTLHGGGPMPSSESGDGITLENCGATEMNLAPGGIIKQPLIHRSMLKLTPRWSCRFLHGQGQDYGVWEL